MFFLSYRECFFELPCMFCWITMNVFCVNGTFCWVIMNDLLSYNECFVELSWMFCWVTMNVLLNYHECFVWVTINVLLSYHECFGDLPLMFCWVTMNVLLSYHECFVELPWMFCWVLPLRWWLWACWPPAASSPALASRSAINLYIFCLLKKLLYRSPVKSWGFLDSFTAKLTELNILNFVMPFCTQITYSSKIKKKYFRVPEALANVVFSCSRTFL